VALESEDARHQAEALCDGEDDAEVMRRFLARHAASS
jgi:hypothetical protein